MQNLESKGRMNDFLCELTYKEKPCLFQEIAKITYEEFSYDERQKADFNLQRHKFYKALEENVQDLKGTSAHTGAFEVVETRHQSSSEKWSQIRSLHCSAQPSRSINKFKSESAKMNFLRRHLWGMDRITTKAMAYGKKNEGRARKKYAEEQQQMDSSVTVEDCGLFLNLEHIGLSCSPDGVVKSATESDRLLEIKILYTLRDKDPNKFDEYLPKKKLAACCLKRDEQGTIQLKQNHPYYDQVQFCMGLVGMTECDFFVWTPVNDLTIRIPFDKARWMELKKSSQDFHWNYLAPEYFAMRTPRYLHPLQLP